MTGVKLDTNCLDRNSVRKNPLTPATAEWDSQSGMSVVGTVVAGLMSLVGTVVAGGMSVVGQ